MRILTLASWWPAPTDNGIKLRIAHLLHALAQEHTIHLAALLDAPPDAAANDLSALCASAVFAVRHNRPRGRAERLADLLGREPASVRASWSDEFAALVCERAVTVNPDLVLVFELGTAVYAHLVPGVPRVLEDLESIHMADQVNCRPAGPQRARARLTWWKHRRFVRDLLQDYALCTVASARELALAQTFAPSHIRLAVIPNGADVSGSEENWGLPEPDTLIYPGSLTYDLNFDAMHYFLGEILPRVRACRPGVRLIITGKTTPELCASLPPAAGVQFAGLVPDIRPLVARAWAEVVPLRHGSGTRLKVLEALALGTPVVSTSKGVEGLELDHERHILLANGAEAFSLATVRLLNDGALREQLAVAGRAAVRERYDWREIGDRLNGLLSEVACAARVNRTGAQP